ncbi:MAG TPA: 2OG-Fe(II) oxygenase [Methylotenera sp.]|nr:2OG-Fe(II) oxygenase [Methylotenera sp.]
MTTNGFLPVELKDGLHLDNVLAREIGEAGMGEYAFAEPFAHTVIDGFLPAVVAEELLAHFPAEKKQHDKVYDKGYGGQFKRQVSPYDCDEWLKCAFAFFNSPAMLEFLEGLTNIKGLIPDPYFNGGGLHEISTGGMLGIHADFQVNEALQLRRRINVLIYLNKDWQAAYGGELELWDKGMQHKVRSVAPLFNRCVIFNTDADSFHGHPDPLTTPADITRKSIALYYYTAQPIENSSGESRHTLYVARPNDTPENIAQAKKLAAKRDKRAKKMHVGNSTGLRNKIKSLLGLD